jgi:hypothetical protein
MSLRLALYSRSKPPNIILPRPTRRRELTVCAPRVGEVELGRPARRSCPTSLASSSTVPVQRSQPIPPRRQQPYPARSYSSTSAPTFSLSPPSDLIVKAVHDNRPIPTSSPSSVQLEISCPSHGIPTGSLFSARWLCDSDRSPTSIQGSGQKWHRSSDVDPAIQLRGMNSWQLVMPVLEQSREGGMLVEEPTLRVDWKGTGMRSSGIGSPGPDTSSYLPLSLLAASSPRSPAPLTSSPLQPPLPPTTPWILPTLLNSPSLYLPYADFLSSPDTLHAALTQLRTFGIFFLDGVPSEDGSHDGCQLRTLANRIGEIRHTFYGEVWDVRALGIKSENVAYTNVDLGLHMDLL